MRLTLAMWGIVLALVAWILYAALTDAADAIPDARQITRNPLLHARFHHRFPAWWLRAALCIHSREGSWQANTGNGFTGGMQFLDTTWRANGGWLYASRAYLATPHEQLHITWNLWRRSGWAPWPNTARMCGLR